MVKRKRVKSKKTRWVLKHRRQGGRGDRSQIRIAEARSVPRTRTNWRKRYEPPVVALREVTILGDWETLEVADDEPTPE